MGALNRFEQRLEHMVTGAFARAFRSAVQPMEIAAALQREVDNSAQILSRDRRLAPNTFRIDLSGADFDRLSTYGDALSRELASMLHEHASEQHYMFAGPVRLNFLRADDLTTGRFRIRSEASAAVTPAAGPTASDSVISRAPMYLDVNGARHPLAPPGLVIGRGTNADLRVDDPGVSRRHVEFRVQAGGAGAQVSVLDLGSTNGTTVDGQRIQHAVLRNGSAVQIGSTRIVLTIADSPAPQRQSPQRPPQQAPAAAPQHPYGGAPGPPPPYQQHQPSAPAHRPPHEQARAPSRWGRKKQQSPPFRAVNQPPSDPGQRPWNG